MRLGAIDIGSNAIRLQITKVVCRGDNLPNFKRLEFIRFPLRLGKEVFKKGRISLENEAKFLELMSVYHSLLSLYEVDAYMACATSAMRESDNGKEIIAKVKANTGLNIEIISGDKEAEIINKAIYAYLDEQNVIHIDVGGGSTEINIYQNHKKINSYSFQLGSVRSLMREQADTEWKLIKAWISEHTKGMQPLMAIGTGGNINKLYDLAKRKTNKTIHINEIKRLREELEKRSQEERMSDFGLNEDRADIILPASEIYLRAMKAAQAEQIIVPKVGLREGIIQRLFERYCQDNQKQSLALTKP
ncbi:MAG: phosphatase [Bernardetiaceae bacterium]|nr:phosphatase [Bernardetiaceae bacterium]